MRGLLILSIGIAFLPALAKEIPVEPGRRDAERTVKQGADAELQHQIDRSMAAARLFLGGSAKTGKEEALTPENLRQRAQILKEASKLCTNGKQKREAERSFKAMLKVADALEAKQEPREGDLKRALEPPPAEPPDMPYGDGEQALVGLALVQAGVAPSDPVIQSIWKRQISADKPAPMETYESSVQLMLADAMMHAPCGEAWPPAGSREEVLAWIRKRAESLASSCSGGAWTYGSSGIGPVRVPSAEPGIGSEALASAAVAKGAHDFSNTQYAVLGLKAAALCGVRPKNAEHVWRLVVQQFLTAQEQGGPAVKLWVLPEKPGPGSLESYEKGWEEAPTGERSRSAQARGWGYVRRSAATHTMTAAGLTALLVGRSELQLTPEETERVNRGIRDGLAWMQKNWDGNGISGKGGAVGGADLAGPVNSYLVYGLERMGVLGELRKVGSHDWYAEGAKRLVATQGKDGAWESGCGKRIDTAFCLLFLCRGTRREYSVHSSPAYEVADAEPCKP